MAVSGQRGRFRGLGGRQNLVVAGGRCGRLLHLCSNQLPRPGHFFGYLILKNGWLANLADFRSAMAGSLKTEKFLVTLRKARRSGDFRMVKWRRRES